MHGMTGPAGAPRIRAFGATFARCLGQPSLPGALAFTAAGRPLAVSRVRTDEGQVRTTEPIPAQDAFHVVLQLRDMAPHDLWLDGRLVRTAPYPRHSISVIDLRRISRTRIATAHEALVFYLDRKALAEMADEYGTAAADTLRVAPGTPVLDPVMARLGASMLPLLADPAAGQMQVDQLLLLAQAHLAGRYGAADVADGVAAGGLAPWQERRAKALMAASVDRQLALAELAREVSLSVGHFSRAFRRSTGLAPHAWMARQRMAAAKAMLLDGRMSVVEVAQAVGYSEQSSFTKAFQRSAGAPPSAWARGNRRPPGPGAAARTASTSRVPAPHPPGPTRVRPAARGG